MLDGGRRELGRVLIVLPAFNEEASIGDLIEELGAVLVDVGAPFSITVVDDGSSDRTPDVALGASERWPVTVLRNRHNLGLGGAIARGLSWAAAEGRAGDVVITMDADLTQSPSYIPSMLASWREGTDVVIASRFRPGARVNGVSPARRIMTYGARMVMTVLLYTPGVRDYSCGYRLYDVRTLQVALAQNAGVLVTQSGFACMVEIVARLRGIALFGEVPFILHYENKRTASALRVIPTVSAYFTVIAGAWTRRLAPGPSRASHGRAKGGDE